mmetsp:Transcript_17058/g.39436  ORF Transcript_17058/g.39436 Transcript_17058/m.39436 type:complete len:205 (-) Transcript_17058:368-982(-)
MTRTHHQSRMIPLQQGHCKALFAIASQQAIGVCQIQSNSHNTSHWSKRNVSFLETGQDSQFAIPLLNDAVASNQGGCVAPRMRCGESKAGNQGAISQTWQKVLLLRRGAVTSEQLSRTQRIGNGHGRIGIKAMRRELGEDTGHGLRREAQSTPFLGNLHPKETFVAHVIPGLLGKVLLEGNLVIIQETAQVVDLIVQECLFFFR